MTTSRAYEQGSSTDSACGSVAGWNIVTTLARDRLRSYGCRHAETGRRTADIGFDGRALAELDAHGQLLLRYASTAGGQPTEVYPDNPNGSMAGIAGICDTTGRVCGFMPHPERHVERTQHPRWTRGEGSAEGDGLRVFRNAVEYFG